MSSARNLLSACDYLSGKGFEPMFLSLPLSVLLGARAAALTALVDVGKGIAAVLIACLTI